MTVEFTTFQTLEQQEALKRHNDYILGKNTRKKSKHTINKENSTVINRIKEVFRNNKGELLSVRDVSNLLPDLTENQVRGVLYRLEVKDGIIKVSRGLWIFNDD